MAAINVPAPDTSRLSRPGEIRKSLLIGRRIQPSWLRKSDVYGWSITLRILIPFFVLIAAAPFLWIHWSPLTSVPVAVLLGVYGYKISFIMHDCSHHTLFRTAKLNTWVGVFCGWLVGAEYHEYKRVHQFHHRYNSTARDPQADEVAGLQGASRGTVIWHLTKALFGFRVLEYLTGYQGEQEPKQGRSKSAMLRWFGAAATAQVAVAVLASGAGQVPLLILLYPVSAATLALFFARLRTFAEHVEPAGRPISNFTRSHRPSWLDSILLYDAHFNFHLEHHLFPHMPSCHLSKLHHAYSGTIHNALTLRRTMLGTIIERVREAGS